MAVSSDYKTDIKSHGVRFVFSLDAASHLLLLTDLKAQLTP